MKKLFSILLLAALFMSSCTVSEPELANGTPSKLRLVAVKSMGITMISVNYDKQGRITKINAGNDMIYELSYEGTSTAPSQVDILEYDEFDVDDKYVRKLTDKTVWTDIRVNSDGYITNCSVQEWTWDYNTLYDYEKDKYILYLDREDYDKYTGEITYSDGHVIRSFDSDGEGNSYTWDGDLLMSWNDGDETVRFTYSDVDNVNLQWDPNNEVFGPLAITGLLGKAPAKFVRSAKFSDGEKIQYSYSLLDNGLINMCRVLDSDSELEPVLNYVYEKVK